MLWIGFLGGSVLLLVGEPNRHIGLSSNASLDLFSFTQQLSSLAGAGWERLPKGAWSGAGERGQGAMRTLGPPRLFRKDFPES